MDKDLRKIKCVYINPQILAHFFTTGEAWQCTRGLPSGARLVSIYTVDEFTQVIAFEHESFDAVPIERAPDLIPHFEKIVVRKEPEFETDNNRLQ